MFVERERKLALERINRGSKADVGRVLQKSELVFYLSMLTYTIDSMAAQST